MLDPACFCHRSCFSSAAGTGPATPWIRIAAARSTLSTCRSAERTGTRCPAPTGRATLPVSGASAPRTSPPRRAATSGCGPSAPRAAPSGRQPPPRRAPTSGCEPASPRPPTTQRAASWASSPRG